MKTTPSALVAASAFVLFLALLAGLWPAARPGGASVNWAALQNGAEVVDVVVPTDQASSAIAEAFLAFTAASGSSSSAFAQQRVSLQTSSYAFDGHEFSSSAEGKCWWLPQPWAVVELQLARNVTVERVRLSVVVEGGALPTSSWEMVPERVHLENGRTGACLGVYDIAELARVVAVGGEAPATLKAAVADLRVALAGGVDRLRMNVTAKAGSRHGACVHRVELHGSVGEA